MRYRLNPSGNFGKQLQRLIQSINEDIVVALLKACRDPETGVHQARKSCKEIRALLRLLRPQIGVEAFRHHQARYRHVAGVLSGSRDAMVMVNTWRALQDERQELQADGFDRVTAMLTERAREDPLTSKGQAFFVDLALEMEAQRFLARDWQLPRRLEDLKPNVRRLYRKARDAERRAQASDDIDDFHDFRKRSKDLFYSLRILIPLHDKRFKKQVQAFEAMTEVQGLANDHAVLSEYLETHRESLGLAADDEQRLTAAIQDRLQALQARAHELAKALLKDKPRVFVKRL